MSTKIAILIPYFGLKPKWFEYFILTCLKNREIDWIFFSDCLFTEQDHPNLKFNQMQLNEFNALATRQIGLKITIKHPYKICDLKPAYGLIFESYIGNYDFWGYGDIDLVYGNILSLLPPNWQINYDIISNHSEFIPGHFCILKNTAKIRNLFQQADNFASIFQSSLYHGFDEILHPLKILPDNRMLLFSKDFKIKYHLIASKIISYLRKILNPIRVKIKKESSSLRIPLHLNDFTSVVKWNNEERNLNAYFKTSYMCDLMLRRQGYKKWIIEWNNGILINKLTGEEIMYFHFIMAKNKSKFIINNFMPATSAFTITKEGIQ